VSETTNASNASGLQLCVARPYNILELALHGVPAEVVEVLLGACAGYNAQCAPSAPAKFVGKRCVQIKFAPFKSVPDTVTFLTPATARRCLLTVVGGPDGWSVARFSTIWRSGAHRFPSAPDVSRWNAEAPDRQHMLLHDDGSIHLCLDVDLDDITLQQVIPLWLRWDHCVEAAREFIVFGVV
jgi:hypothetical protein